ncbi:MAG: DUF87 domain-containing protein [Candidatus Berkelbacteria bacterium]
MRKVDWLNSQEYTILRIDVPRNNDKSPMSAEQMFASIHGIFSETSDYQNHLSFEIVSKEKYIQFYVYLPVHLKDFIEGQIYAQYPSVEINEVDDYVQEVDISQKNCSICELKLNKPDVYPIKQFTDFEVDPISGITSVMSKLNSGEEVWFQMIIRPIGDDWQEKGHAMTNSVRSGAKPGGKSFAKTIFKGLFGFLKEIAVQAVQPGADTTVVAKEVKLPASVEEALKSIEQKITKLGFESKIRIACIGHDPVSVKLKCQNIAGAFKQYNTTNLNGFRVGEIRVNDPISWKDFAYRSFEDDGNVFNIAELASIYHFPHSSVATPNIVWSGSKKGEPPANIPLQDNTPADELTVIGETNFRNIFKIFGIKKDDRRRHVYIVGKSGVGKSVLIENMAHDDVMEGRGVIIVDPHGELADKILSCVPENRIEDVVVFDPSDRDYPVAFNLLENVDDDFKSIVASGFVGIFKKIFGDSWGPRLEHILRNTVLALLDYPESTMLDIPRMLTNNGFRDKVVEQVKDPVIKDFWQNEFAAYDAKFKTEAVSPILNKVGQFLASSTIRNIVGQPHSTIDVRDIMDKKKIMIVNLSRGKIGEDNSALLGAMMITKIQLAAMSRADVPVEQRPDCYLYVDEFQNFATESFAVILAEARKYNLNLTMAHQYIAQMIDPVKDAVFGNAGTLITFRVGGTDAEVLVKEYAPIFEANDLVNLDKYNIYIKLLIDGVSSPAFSARTLPPVMSISGNAEKVVNYSHQRYSSTRALVEASFASIKSAEEDELRASSEAFRKGGLEALLVKKPASDIGNYQRSAPTPQPTFVRQSENVVPSTIAPITPEIAPVTQGVPVSTVSTSMQTGSLPSDISSSADQATPSEDEKPRNEEPRGLKYQNIIAGKLYKERTARGNVKWYLGEEIDEQKLAETGIVVDDNAKKMIELSKKVSANHVKATHIAHHTEAPQHAHKVAEHTNDKPVEAKPAETHALHHTSHQPHVEHQVTPSNLPAVQDHSNLPEIAPEVLPMISNDLPEVAPSIVPADHTVKNTAAPILMPTADNQEEPRLSHASHTSSHTHTAAAAPTTSPDAKHLEEGKAVQIGE